MVICGRQELKPQSHSVGGTPTLRAAETVSQQPGPSFGSQRTGPIPGGETPHILEQKEHVRKVNKEGKDSGPKKARKQTETKDLLSDKGRAWCSRGRARTSPEPWECGASMAGSQPS